MSRVRGLIRRLDPASARRLKLTVPASLVLAVLESVGLALLLPLITALADPRLLESGGLMGDIYDLSEARTVDGFVGLVGSAVLVLFVVRIVLQVLFVRWQTGVLASADAKLTADLFTQYIRRDYAFHSSRNSAELVYTVRQVAPTVVWNYLLPAAVLFTDILVLAALVGTLVLIDPVGAFSAVAVLTLAGSIYLLAVSRRNRRYTALSLGVDSRAQHLIQEGLSGIKVLKILGRGSRVSDAFAATRLETADYARRLRFGGQLPRFFLEVALTVALATIVTMTLLRTDGPDAVASLGLLAAGGFRMLPSFQRILNGLNTMQTSQPFVDRLLTEFAQLDQLAVDRGDAEVDGLDFLREIRLRDLSFRYPAGEVEALSRIDLKIQRGEFVALVGPSGAGKSTLADIVLGLLEPTAGQFEVDGVRIEGERIARWRRVVGYVPQETFIFDNTLRANVALGLDPAEIDAERLASAIAAAHLDGVVAELPGGLETVLGEKGSRLSGGQRQRVGLARALYDQPAVLVLDEATSSLDGVTEAAIAETIEELSEAITVIVIAHRLATVQRCDRLVHIDKGRVVSMGTFAELVERDPTFRAQARAAGVLWREDTEVVR